MIILLTILALLIGLAMGKLIIYTIIEEGVSWWIKLLALLSSAFIGFIISSNYF